MKRWVGSRSIGVKLMMISAVLVLLFLGGFTYGISAFTSSIISRNSIAELKNQAELVKNIIEVFNNNLKKSTTSLSDIFVSYFPSRFSLDPSRRVMIGEVSTPVLKNGAEVLNLNFKTIDRFTQMTGVAATVFARQGDDFVRITTSLKKEDGARAIGTLLGKQHPAYDNLMRGEGYLGRAALFGKMYSTRYVPIKDGSGEVIGVLFVGLEITDGLNFLKEKIKSIKIAETGYIYALNGEAGKSYGTFAIHPFEEGKNSLDARDAGGREFIKEILKNKKGVITYSGLDKEPGETKPRDKIAAYTSFDEWNWVIVAGAYHDELTRGAVLLQRYLIGATCAIVALLLISLYVASRRMVSIPLGRGVAFAQAIAAGDLSQSLEIRSKDEVGDLAGALNTMVASLNEMVGRIKSTSEQVASAAGEISANSIQLTKAAHSQASATDETSSTMEQMSVSIQSVATNADVLAANTEEVSAAVQELGGTGEQMVKSAEVMASSVSETSASIEQMTVSIEKVAQNAEKLASSVSETSSTVEQMTVSIEQVADNTLELQKIVTETAGTVEQMAVSIKQTADNVTEADTVAKAAAKEGLAGQQAVQEALAAMKRVAEVSDKTAASILNLGKRSEEIGNIVRVINEIADQTNLLALNAAIEAARAGDAGRGFAVVADEVRKLAERSVNATKEIGQVIRQVQADTNHSVKYGQLASREAQSSMELSSVAGNALANIVKSIEQTSDLMSNIARMTTEQAAASSQVIDSVEKMSQSSAMVANAAREQALGGRQIRIAVERMNGITHEVTNATREQAQGSRQIRSAVENMNHITQQVTMAAREQALSAREISAAIGAMNSMTQQVANATLEQRKGGDMVVVAMESISDVTRENLVSVAQLSKSAESLSQGAIDLAGLVARFSVDDRSSRLDNHF